MLAPTKELIHDRCSRSDAGACAFFFLFLPITDRRTVMLKLAMITVIAALFAGSAMTCGPSPPSQTVAMSGN
jgi:hypothetical protein